MDLSRLVEQSEWANLRWVEFVYSQSNPEVRPRELLTHIMDGERIWFERIDGHPRTTGDVAMLSREELVQGFAENTATYRRFIRDQLTRVVHFRRASGEEYHATVEDILLHLFTHGYHHRGQLAAHYARSGVKYPNTDHIHYLLVNKL
jgi:uncharacterized damage-inducible protein DinB